MNQTETKQTNKSKPNQFASGLISGAFTRFFSSPVDLVKIRMQLQLNHSNASILKTIKQTYSREGLIAFWKGNMSGTICYSLYTSTQFYSYNKISSTVDSSFIAGGLGGIAATIVSYPFDLLRTRFSIQSSENKLYENILSAIKTIYKTETPKSLFKGLGITCFQIFPTMGISFLVFNNSKKFLKQKEDEEKIKYDAMCGALAGFISKFCVYPADVIRKRLQVTSLSFCKHIAIKLNKAPNSKSVINMIQFIYKAEGLGAFYRGLSVALLKSGYTSSLVFVSYAIASKNI